MTAATSEHKPDAEKAWWVWRHYNARQASDPRSAFMAGYRRAYLDAISDTSQFARLPESLERLSDLLEDARIEREAIREWQER
jgi:hypothetical protein